MSANTEKNTESAGSKLMKKLSHKISPSKEDSNQSGSGQDILDRAGSIREQVSHGNYGAAAQEMFGKGQSSASAPRKAETEAAMREQQAGRENSEGTAQQISGKEQSGANASSQAEQTGGDMGDSKPQEKAEEAGRRLFGTNPPSQEFTGQQQTGVGLWNGDGGQGKKDGLWSGGGSSNKNENTNLESTETGRRSSRVLKNQDIKRGPITQGYSLGKRDSTGKKSLGGVETRAGAGDSGSGSKDVPSTGKTTSANPNQANAESQANVGRSRFSDASLDDELSEQGHIGSDVFGGGSAGRGISEQSGTSKDIANRTTFDSRNVNRGVSGMGSDSQATSSRKEATMGSYKKSDTSQGYSGTNMPQGIYTGDGTSGTSQGIQNPSNKNGPTNMGYFRTDAAQDVSGKDSLGQNIPREDVPVGAYSKETKGVPRKDITEAASSNLSSTSQQYSTTGYTDQGSSSKDVAADISPTSGASKDQFSQGGTRQSTLNQGNFEQQVFSPDARDGGMSQTGGTGRARGITNARAMVQDSGMSQGAASSGQGTTEKRARDITTGQKTEVNSTQGGPGLEAARSGGLDQGFGQRGIRTDGFRSGGTKAMTGRKIARGDGTIRGSSYKVTVLQEKIQTVSQKCKTQLGLSASEVSQRSPKVEVFFDVVAAERLRWMPRDGSRLDCSLRWASRLAYAVDALRESVGAFAPGATEAAMLIWGFCILLLESDIDNTDLLESIFGRYGRVAVGIHLLLQYQSAYKSSPELQPEAAAAFADLLEMVCNTSGSCIEGFKSKESNQVISHNVDGAFITYARRYSTHWNCIVESSTSKLVDQSSEIYASPELGSLRQFLSVQDRPLQFILEARSHTLAEGSFEWFNNALYDFTVGSSPMMLVSGGPGSGKSALAQWTVDRLQESAEHDAWDVIPYTIRADIPVATLPLRILKGILHQMLDHCVSDPRTQEAVLVEVAKAAQGALDGSSETEIDEALWKGIRTGLKSNIQYMFVVDGLDQIKGGEKDALACLGKFHEVLSEQSAGSKMIAFSRPLSSKMPGMSVQQFNIQPSQTQTDMGAYVRKMLYSESQFGSFKDDQLDSAVAAIVDRSQGSFSWAEMAVVYARQQRTLNHAVSSVHTLPQSMTEFLDFHFKNIDFNQHETRCVMSWLAASERPLLVEEVDELLKVDAKGSGFKSRRSSGDTSFTSMAPLVMTRDGVVSFAHTCIRDHVITQARSHSTKSGLDLKEAHYDLLARCLAWVQLSVREEADLSMDKLNMEERNRLFDKYVLLEYTARYWLSHLLSSPLVSDEGEFQFSNEFIGLLPATVLFARLELTCKESQFTRSSVLELYRLSTDIRRIVLGEKSPAFLQSLLLSARVAKLAHADYADEHCYEAWRLSQELLGQSYSITLTCTEMMTQSFSEKDTITSSQEDIMKYLILTDSEITGVDFNQRLRYLGMIVGMYKSRGDTDSALLMSKQFYQQILQKYGSNSSQSSEAAEFLTEQFSTTGSDEMSRDIARTKYDNMVRTMDVTDERRIKYSLYMAQMYEQLGDILQAQSILSNLWAGLASCDIDSVDMMDKKANVALVYYQFLRRQGYNDEAEVIIRELVADLEITGVHSPEIMQRVQMLRAETREMHLYSLDRSLAVLMWRYYKENNLEYTTEAKSLALSLAETMSNTVSIEDASSLSTRDRKLLVELLDSITSSPSNLSVNTLILCHNLASIYVREEDWAAASDCAMAVLQHVWPSVERPSSYHKFSTELAPPVADIALILAYCHFRRLHLQQATVVYENAFGSLISSDKVPVASVLAVAKAVVEFYETSFQFEKALTLLHTVSNFLSSRLGGTHKHTIENMYLEAGLATRLEMNNEAKSAYQRIYHITMHNGKISPEGMEAALALIGLYEKEMQWNSALDIYRHLWPTLVVKDGMRPPDPIQEEALLEKTYLGYMSILTSRTKSTDFSERYQVASEYVNTCRNVYGPTHEKTLNATLLFAELCETSDSYTDQAISLYKQALQTNEWVPSSQSAKSLDQMTQPLPITLKHKMAELFVRKHDSSNEARLLYMEEFQLAKKTQGLFSATTLSWLRELALAHARQGTSIGTQQGNAILHAYVTDVLYAGGETEMMDDWARKIAAIYLECGFIENGNSMLDELRQRVMSGSDTSAMTLGDRRDAVFVAAFEEVFGRRATSVEIMTEMAREVQIQQTFSQNLSGHDFIPTLASGDRLARLQTQQKCSRAAMDTRSRLYDYFCSSLSATDVADKEVVQQFYRICLQEVHNDNYNINILGKTTNLVRDLCNLYRFEDASTLTGVLHSFLHLTDGLNDYESITTATRLCLYLSGHNATKCEDEKTFRVMSIKSKQLLQEIMEASKSIGMEIIDLPFPELNDIITLLGEHEMFDDLEAILTRLWTSRIVQRTWTPDVVVWIGRRLVEARFCRGAVDSAIQLCRDICYNLRQVWGSCDGVTLEMTKLLSALYTASENHQSAATLHEGVLYDLINDSEAKNHPRAADTASQHMELLRRAQSRMGSAGKASTRTSAHEDLYAQVIDRFGLQSEQIKDVGEAHGGDQFGMWSRPRRFSLDVEDLDDQTQGQMHHNHLRESSSAGLLNGSGAPRRVSVQAL